MIGQLSPQQQGALCGLILLTIFIWLCLVWIAGETIMAKRKQKQYGPCERCGKKGPNHQARYKHDGLNVCKACYHILTDDEEDRDQGGNK